MIKYYKSEEKKDDKEYEHFDTSDTSDTSNTSSLSNEKTGISDGAIAIFVIIIGALYIYISHRSLKGKKEINTDAYLKYAQEHPEHLNNFIKNQESSGIRRSYDQKGLIHYVGHAGSRTI